MALRSHHCGDFNELDVNEERVAIISETLAQRKVSQDHQPARVPLTIRS
jgi:hypothetical protein